MPTVPPSTIKDVARDQRLELKKLSYEAAVLKYSFSYAKLLELADGDTDAIQRCIVAYTEDEQKVAAEKLKDRIGLILKENKLASVREPDPFGRMKDIVRYDSTSTSRPEAAIIEAAVKNKVSVDKITKILEEATKKTPITIVSVKDVPKVKEKKEKPKAKVQGEGR